MHSKSDVRPLSHSFWEGGSANRWARSSLNGLSSKKILKLFLRVRSVTPWSRIMQGIKAYQTGGVMAHNKGRLIVLLDDGVIKLMEDLH